MGQPACAHLVNGLVVHHHGDVHIDVEAVGAVQDLLPDLLPLPGVVVRDMAELGHPLRGFQLPQGGEGVGLPAVFAGQGGALSQGLALGAAGGALVEDPVQAVGPEGLLHPQAGFLLPAEVVKGEGLVQPVGQLLYRLFPDFLGGVQAAYLGGHGNRLADLQLVVKGIPGKGAKGLHHHHGHGEFLQQHPQLPGQGCGGAVEGVACLGVHEHADAQGVQAVVNILNQPQVGDKFPGGDTADGAHQRFLQPAQAHEAVGGADDAVGPGKKYFTGDHQVQEAGVVHEDQAGLPFFDFLHALLGVEKAGSRQAEGAQQADQPPPEEGRFPGQPVGRQGDGGRLFIIKFLYGGFHTGTSFCGGSCPGMGRGAVNNPGKGSRGA